MNGHNIAQTALYKRRIYQAGKIDRQSAQRHRDGRSYQADHRLLHRIGTRRAGQHLVRNPVPIAFMVNPQEDKAKSGADGHAKIAPAAA